MRQVVESQAVEEQASGGQARGLQLRFRLLYYLTVILVATVMAGLLRFASLLE